VSLNPPNKQTAIRKAAPNRVVIIWPYRRRVGGVSRVVENLSRSIAKSGTRVTVQRRTWTWVKRGGTSLFAKATSPLALLVSRSRCIVIVHDVGYLESPSHYGLLQSAYFRLTLHAIAIRRHTVVVPSDFTKRRMSATFRRANRIKVIVVPWGVSQRSPSARVERADRIDTIFCPRLGHPRKQSQIVAAASQILAERRGSPIVFETTGLSSQEAQSQDWFSALHRGTLSEADFWEAFARASVCVYVSSYEGFGLPVLEAQSLGIPVVVQEGTACADIIGLGGSTCSGTPQSVASAIEFCLDNRSSLSELARENAQGYSWEFAATAILTLCKQST
jgi:glycosyltransferase involved in cell wall biosynthesis